MSSHAAPGTVHSVSLDILTWILGRLSVTFPFGDTSCADFVASSHFVFPPILDLFGQCRNTGGAEVKVDPTQSDPQLTYCG